MDDNDDGREMLALFLALEGHEVQTATDGAEALESATSFRPDVICTDILMPGLSGIELHGRLRRSPAFSAVVVFAITALPAEEQRRLKQMGFDRVFMKPVDLDALSESIHTVARCRDTPAVT